MANSPAHRFGQIVGDLLEEILEPPLEAFCTQRGLFLDKKGHRADVRKGKKVSWQDKYENLHDLDFVIEKGGSAKQLGRPVAFIESAWRRYTKHSRNKAQEIQGAILPIAEKYSWDKPFLGVVLAGLFTSGSLTQMKSSGFEVALFPYDSVVEAFASVGIDADFDEGTPDDEFAECVAEITSLTADERNGLKAHLVQANQSKIDSFFVQLMATLDRVIERIIILPLHGRQEEFESIGEASQFIRTYSEAQGLGDFRKYEIIVRFSNSDSIDAMFRTKEEVFRFLDYVGN